MFSASIAILPTILVLLVIRQTVQSSNQLTAVHGINSVADTYKLYTEQQDNLNHETSQAQVLQQFRDLDHRVRNVDSQLKLGLFKIHEIGADAVRTLVLHGRLLSVKETIDAIVSQLPSYDNLTQLNNVTILQMADELLRPYSGLPSDLHYLQLQVSDVRASGSIEPIRLPDLMLDYFEGNDLVQCSLGKSVQLAMLEYIEKVQLVRIRAAAAVSLAYWLQAEHRGISLVSETDHFNEELRNCSGVIAEVWQAALGRADRRVWRCDPVEHRKHQTFDQLSVQRGFITSEQEIDDGCRQSCSELAAKVDFAETVCEIVANSIDAYNTCSPNPQRHVCNGGYSECQFLGRELKLYGATDNAMHAVRVQNEDGKVYGSYSSRNLPLTQVSSYYRYLFNRCDQCYCLCRQPNDNRFSRDWAMAAHENGFVVTGIRIHKDSANAVVRLQIQEGRIERLGRIQERSVRWRSLSSTLSDSEKSELFTSNSMYMKEVEAPAGHVICGVRFQSHLDRVGLQIRTCSFQSSSGQLNCADISESATENTNSVLHFHVKNSDVPTRSESSKRTASANRDILFVATGVEQDFGQNTVPFLDIQEVVSQPPVALIGIGLYHKGRPGYGGFIGAEMSTMDAQTWIEHP